MDTPIEISKEAAMEIKTIMDTKNIPADYQLRITVKGSRGCAGAVLTLGFDKKGNDDLHFNVNAIPVLISKKELIFIAGKKVNFYSGADARGFLFEDIDA